MLATNHMKAHMDTQIFTTALDVITSSASQTFHTEATIHPQKD
jgi:hypothetical protein